MVCAGIHMSDIPAFPYDLLWGERTVRSVANLTRRDGTEFLALAQRIPVHAEVETLPLDQANVALTRLRDGKVQGALLVPDRVSLPVHATTMSWRPLDDRDELPPAAGQDTAVQSRRATRLLSSHRTEAGCCSFGPEAEPIRRRVSGNSTCTATPRPLFVDPAALEQDDGAEVPAEERMRRERARESSGGIVRFSADRDARGRCSTLAAGSTLRT